MNKDTKKKFSFKVEDQSFDSPEEKITAKAIIELAQKKGISNAQGQIDTLTLKGENKIYYLNDIVDLSKDNDFSLGIKVYKFKVNGQELESNSKKLLASDIIKMAQNKDVPLPAEIKDLLLQAVGVEQEFNLNDWVDFSKFDNFLLIVNKPTPVA